MRNSKIQETKTESYEVKFNHHLESGQLVSSIAILKFGKKVDPSHVEKDFMAVYGDKYKNLEIKSIKYQ